MLLAPVVPAPVAGPEAPLSPRSSAARDLVAVPVKVFSAAQNVAFDAVQNGRGVSRADLLAPVLAEASIEELGQSLRQAVDGAAALLPESVTRAGAMRAAINGVVALLEDAAVDTTVVSDPIDAAEALMTDLLDAADPIFESAILLDPEVIGTASRW